MTLSMTRSGAPELEVREIVCPVSEQASTSPTLRPRIEVVPQNNNKKIKIIVVADLICVWCYIAFNELNQAIEDLKKNYASSSVESTTPTASTSQPTVPEIDVEYRPFFINTTAGTQDEPIDRLDYFISRFGKERVTEIMEFAKTRGRECGIDFHFNAKMRQTMRVHRLLYLAYARGGSALQTKLYARLYRDFFEQPDPFTIDVTSVPQLATYAVEIGLIPDFKAAVAWLLSRAGEEDVMRLTSISCDCGISGVPFTVMEGKWAIGGGMEKGLYYRTLEKIVLAQSQQQTETAKPTSYRAASPYSDDGEDTSDEEVVDDEDDEVEVDNFRSLPVPRQVVPVA